MKLLTRVITTAHCSAFMLRLPSFQASHQRIANSIRRFSTLKRSLKLRLETNNQFVPTKMYVNVYFLVSTRQKSLTLKLNALETPFHLQKTDEDSAELWHDEIQFSLDYANRHADEARQCEYCVVLLLINLL